MQRRYITRFNTCIRRIVRRKDMENQKIFNKIYVKEWENYKELVLKLKPRSLYYSIIPAPLSKPPVALRITFTSAGNQYIFFDLPHWNHLRKTKIQIKSNKRENCINSEDIKQLIIKQLGGQNIHIHPLELI